jgi:hypothetical protein
MDHTAGLCDKGFSSHKVFFSAHKKFSSLDFIYSSLTNNIHKKYYMSVTLLCLVKGNTTANAFPVDIGRDQLVGHLKKVIKAEKQNDFAGVDADKLKLWKVKIPGDNNDHLRNISLKDSDELVAINDIGDYWSEKPPKKHIHVIVEPPVSTATSSREQELLDRITSLEESLNKSVYRT